MDEDHINTLGIKPLVNVVNVVKQLFNQSKTTVDLAESEQHIFKTDSHAGLTAALAYLHSRGTLIKAVRITKTYHVIIGIDALFEFVIEGDAAEDPNAMTLWFYQPGFGLPSKACDTNPLLSVLNRD